MVLCQRGVAKRRLQKGEIKRVDDSRYVQLTVQSNKERKDIQEGGCSMLYGLETMALMKRQKAEFEVAWIKMSRFSLGVTGMHGIRMSTDGQYMLEV